MSTTNPETGRARGFALPSAIFLLVVLAALGAFIVSVSTAQHSGQALDLFGARAYQAARTGVEWGVYKVVSGDATAVAFRTACQGAAYAAPTSFDLGAGALAGDLAGFSVTVTCGSGAAASAESGNAVWVYQITATACNQPNAVAPLCPNPASASQFYVERQIRVTVSG